MVINVPPCEKWVFCVFLLRGFSKEMQQLSFSSTDQIQHVQRNKDFSLGTMKEGFNLSCHSFPQLKYMPRKYLTWVTDIKQQSREFLWKAEKDPRKPKTLFIYFLSEDQVFLMMWRSYVNCCVTYQCALILVVTAFAPIFFSLAALLATDERFFLFRWKSM